MRIAAVVAEDIMYARSLPQAENLLKVYIREVIDDIREHVEYIGLGMTDASRVEKVLEGVKQNLK